MSHARPFLREEGLSDQQWRVLRVLGEHANDDGVDTGHIASEAFLLGPSLSGVLTRMERDGLIERTRGTTDARRSVVRATRLGLNKVHALSRRIQAHYRHLEQQLGKPQLHQLYQLLDQLIAEENPASSNESHAFSEDE